MVTHNIDDAIYLSSRVCVMSGRLGGSSTSLRHPSRILVATR